MASLPLQVNADYSYMRGRCTASMMMFLIFYIVCLLLFFSIPPLVLWFRFKQIDPIPWTLVLIIVASFSWITLNVAVFCYYEHLGMLLDAQAHPDPELYKRWSNDGSKRVFTLFLGWTFGIIYLLPWIAVYQLVDRHKTSS